MPNFSIPQMSPGMPVQQKEQKPPEMSPTLEWAKIKASDPGLAEIVDMDPAVEACRVAYNSIQNRMHNSDARWASLEVAAQRSLMDAWYRIKIATAKRIQAGGKQDANRVHSRGSIR